MYNIQQNNPLLTKNQLNNMINIENIKKIEPKLKSFYDEGSIHPEFTADELTQIQLCIDWLKVNNRKINSYSIKHKIEKEIGTYVLLRQ